MPDVPRTLVIGCGALAREMLEIVENKPKEAVEYDDMIAIDKWAIDKLTLLIKDVTDVIIL